MITKGILTKTQRCCLTFTLALALTLAWTALARADGPGDLDITFGGTGVVTDSISSGNDGGLSVAIQPDGKIVVAGISDEAGANDSFAVIRYNSDGSRDTSFNNTGVVTTPVGTFGNYGFSVAIQPDDKIVIAGGSNNPAAWGGSKFAVLRYNITGTLDTDFNNGTGFITTSIGSSFDIGRSMALQPDGKIVVVGDSDYESSSGSDIAVVRYTITGTLDATFNNTGIVTTRITSGFDGGRSVVIQPDEKIMVAGFSGSYNITVVRYTITGTLDTSFNGTGIVTIPNGSGNSVALQPDGKIVVAGSSGSDFAVVRYNSDGSPDTTFNGTGIVITPITSDNDAGQSVAIQPNGKLVVTGFSGNTLLDEGDIAVVRYNSDGSLDTTFGNTGVLTNPISNNLDAAWGVAIQPDGKIVVAGFSNGGAGKATFAVMRYLGDPPVTLTKTVNNDTPNPGQLITYTLAISNSGSFSTTNLLISDTLPLSLTLAGDVALNPPQPGAILATSALSLPTVASSVTISPFTGITVTIPVTVGAELGPGVYLTNTATISSPEMSIPVTDTAVITIATVIVDPGVDLYLPVILKNQ